MEKHQLIITWGTAGLTLITTNPWLAFGVAAAAGTVAVAALVVSGYVVAKEVGQKRYAGYKK